MLLERTSIVSSFLRPSIAIARPNSMVGNLGGVERSDLPYIYHHLRSGCILSLRPICGSEGRHLFFNVSYGGFHLGILGRQLADRVRELEAEGRVYRLTVESLTREKYLPPTAVTVVLEWGAEG